MLHSLAVRTSAVNRLKEYRIKEKWPDIVEDKWKAKILH